jgi:phosphoribosylcarboxyaminoimidazole (NCAIR) mutase
MPAGIPVACVGIGNAANAALLAVEIIGSADPAVRQQMREYRNRFEDDAN